MGYIVRETQIDNLLVAPDSLVDAIYPHFSLVQLSSRPWPCPLSLALPALESEMSIWYQFDINLILYLILSRNLLPLSLWLFLVLVDWIRLSLPWLDLQTHVWRLISASQVEDPTVISRVIVQAAKALAEISCGSQRQEQTHKSLVSSCKIIWLLVLP